MNYQRIHDEIINKARLTSPIGHKRKANTEYKEQHHIKPKCLFENKKDPLMNAPENLVFLTPNQHFVIHHLLTKIYHGNLKILQAFHVMFAFTKDNKRNNDLKWKNSVSKRYELFRILHSQSEKPRASNYKHSEETLVKMRSWKRLPHSIETRKKLSTIKKGKSGHKWTTSQREKMIKSICHFTYQITTPEKEIIIINNLSEYCKKMNLEQSAMVSVSLGKLSHYKNYLVTNLTRPAPIKSRRTYEITTPNNEKIILYTSFKKFCQENNLSAGMFSNILNEKSGSYQKTHKGFSIRKLAS